MQGTCITTIKSRFCVDYVG